MAKQGTDLEKIVEIIERSFSPEAKIEHNVFLPILTSSEGHTAQCDIVIRKGIQPRETITIVEVQDRNSKVDINTFRGWLGKLEDVGAQHLICVSRNDFPSSIKEKVSQSGSKVLLITLKELTVDRIPLEFVNFIFQYRSIDIKNVANVRLLVAPGQIAMQGLKDVPLNYSDKIWSLDGVNKLSIVDICKKEVSVDEKQLGGQDYVEGVGELSFRINDVNPIFFSVNEELIRVGLDCDFEWGFEYAEVPMSLASYEQDRYGALAWLFEIVHKTRSGVVSIKLPVVKLEDGNYKLLDSIIDAPFEYSAFVTKKD
ncbi:hypothetical protein ACFPAG_08045 [Vogesella sp. GCM10023246]|uniref:Restriction endonuclease type IV Mrr domain-containing protein n=1 Tax=Vogesella oryzagri TaxID=3160864 RepID=A0ABV1M2V8_9NEIS